MVSGLRLAAFALSAASAFLAGCAAGPVARTVSPRAASNPGVPWPATDALDRTLPIATTIADGGPRTGHTACVATLRLPA